MRKQFRDELVAELESVVKTIPRGRVASYSGVGRAMKNPTTGRIVGQYMKHFGHGLPWWRVVAKSGLIALAKSDPVGAAEQRARLMNEGVEFNGDRIPTRYFIDAELG